MYVMEGLKACVTDGLKTCVTDGLKTCVTDGLKACVTDGLKVCVTEGLKVCVTEGLKVCVTVCLKVCVTKGLTHTSKRFDTYFKTIITLTIQFKLSKQSACDLPDPILLYNGNVARRRVIFSW